MWCRENHTRQEAGACSGIGFVHDPFEVIFNGVLTQVEPHRDFFIGKSEHEVSDNHLLTLSQMIALLNKSVGAS